VETKDLVFDPTTKAEEVEVEVTKSNADDALVVVIRTIVVGLLF